MTELVEEQSRPTRSSETLVKFIRLPG